MDSKEAGFNNLDWTDSGSDLVVGFCFRSTEPLSTFQGLTELSYFWNDNVGHITHRSFESDSQLCSNKALFSVCSPARRASKLRLFSASISWNCIFSASKDFLRSCCAWETANMSLLPWTQPKTMSDIKVWTNNWDYDDFSTNYSFWVTYTFRLIRI